MSDNPESREIAQKDPGSCAFCVFSRLFSLHAHSHPAALLLCLSCAVLNLRAGTELEFDHPSGFYEKPFVLALQDPVHHGQILYTTNGADPTAAEGTIYERPIPIVTTTILRAAAFDGDGARPDIVSKTYLFLADVLTQTGSRFPENWATNAGPVVPAHYRLRPPTADDAGRHAIMDALAALPSLSIVTEPDNLFSAQTGIYTHPMERGKAWERPASIELLDPASVITFQADCGLRIHGGMSRQSEESPKHSFRLVFKRRYGRSKLQVPLFGEDGPRRFDSLVLRAGNNDSWLASDGQARRAADYIRDEWMRRSLLAMGYPSARGRFVHLYLNGLYWGLYNLCERPGPSLFADAKDWPEPDFDSRKGDKIESGDDVAWNEMMALANAGLSQPQAFQQLSQGLDLTQLTDFLILNFYAANTDWDHSANWYAFRPRIPGGKFRFLVWDGECILRDPRANTVDFDDDQSPPRLFQKLSENAEFRTLFARRAARLLFDDGPLAPGPAAARYAALVAMLDKAIAAEAARWGSYRRDVHPYKTGPYELYTHESHWRPEVDRLLGHYFPQRREILLGQFREHGLDEAIPHAGRPPITWRENQPR